MCIYICILYHSLGVRIMIYDDYKTMIALASGRSLRLGAVWAYFRTAATRQPQNPKPKPLNPCLEKSLTELSRSPCVLHRSSEEQCTFFVLFWDCSYTFLLLLANTIATIIDISIATKIAVLVVITITM